MKAVIYSRVSTMDQGIEGTSLESQIEACKRYANKRGYETTYIIRDTFSGLTLERPGLQQVLGLVRAKEIDALVIYSSDRFSRDGLDLPNLVRECELNGVTERQFYDPLPLFLTFATDRLHIGLCTIIRQSPLS